MTEPGAYVPGRDLGRPPEGPGSVAGPGRRIISLLVDWALCVVIARAFLGTDPAAPSTAFYPVLVLVLENALLVPTAGATLGQRVAGVQTERLDGARVGWVGGLARSVLLGLWLPVVTLLWHPDLRGAHDLASGAVVVLRR